MVGFIVFVAVIVIVIIFVKKKKNERLKEELMNSFGYINIVKPLQSALEKEGYRVDSSSPSKELYGYSGTMYVYKADGHDMLGSIYFATCSADLDSSVDYLISENIGADNGEVASGYKKYMAIQNGKIGVLLKSAIATATNPPDIPEWLMIGARVFEESGYEFTDPDWVSEEDDSDYEHYLNVMFR